MLVSRDDLSRVSTMIQRRISSRPKGTSWGLTVVAPLGQWGMTTPTLSAWKKRFCQRTAELRDAHGWTQQQMADALAIPVERYKKYEQRSPLPHHLVPRFCLILGADMAELFAVDRPSRKGRGGTKAAS